MLEFLSAPDVYGNIPLHLACMTNSVDVITEIAKHTSDLNQLNNECRSPFFIAAIHCDVKVIDYCRNIFKPDIQLTDIRGTNILHWAVRLGKEDKISYLVNIGVNLNTPALDNRTPCEVPSLNSSLRPEEGILKSMKDIQNVIKAAFKAIKTGSSDITFTFGYEKYLDEFGCTLLHQCAKSNNFQMALKCVQYMSRSDQDIFGRTPLRCAIVSEASPELIQLFKDNQATLKELKETKVKGEEANNVQFTGSSNRSGFPTFQDTTPRMTSSLSNIPIGVSTVPNIQPQMPPPASLQIGALQNSNLVSSLSIPQALPSGIPQQPLASSPHGSGVLYQTPQPSPPVSQQQALQQQILQQQQQQILQQQQQQQALQQQAIQLQNLQQQTMQQPQIPPQIQQVQPPQNQTIPPIPLQPTVPVAPINQGNSVVTSQQPPLNPVYTATQPGVIPNVSPLTIAPSDQYATQPSSLQQTTPVITTPTKSSFSADSGSPPQTATNPNSCCPQENQLSATVKTFLTAIDLQSYADVLEQNGIHWVAQLIEQKDKLSEYIPKEGHLREVKRLLSNIPEYSDPIPSWLAKHSLSNYTNAFRDAGIYSILRLNLLKETDLDTIGVKKGHRKEIIKRQEIPPKPSLNLSSLEYDLFLAMMRISPSKTELIENGYDKIPLLVNLDAEACEKYHIPLGTLRQIEYEFSEYLKRSPRDTIPDEENLTSPPAADLRKMACDNGLADYIDDLIENGYDTLERLNDLTKPDLQDMGFDETKLDDILSKILSLTPKRTSKIHSATPPSS